VLRAWISTRQLDLAKRVLRRGVKAFTDHVRRGGLVLGLEPSCTTVFRCDAPELLPNDPDVQRLAEHTVTLAELLTEHSPDWAPPKLSAHALAQVHWHQHAVLGWDADQKLLERCGIDTRQLASGCCGLAGNFGFNPATSTSAPPALSASCCPKCARRRETPPSSPTASAAAPRSSNSTRPATGRCTWPSSSPTTTRRYGAALPPGWAIGVDAPVLRMARAGYRIEG
jgi:hypothetical protein